MKTPKKHILITGGKGFIGTNLVKAIEEHTNDLVTVVDIKSLTPAEIKSNKYKGMDFTDNLEMYKLFNDCKSNKTPITHVVHLAGQVGIPDSYSLPYRDANINIMGTLKLLEICSSFNVKRFVLASSTAVIGRGIDLQDDEEINESTPTIPVSPYGISKLASELYLSSQCCTYNKMEGISLRFSNIYGPYSEYKTSVIHRFIREAFDNKEIIINGNGEQTRDFLYVKDLCTAIYKSLAANMHNNKYIVLNVAFGSSYSVNTVANLVVHEFKNKFNKNIKVTYQKPRLGDINQVFISSDNAKLLLGWKAIIGLPDGVLSTIDYYKEKY